MATRRKAGTITGTLKPADPFELIRWLARSQNDPRKALAELVQNSLDARATRVEITRFRERGVTGLRIHDNGSGVVPEMSREDALKHIATNVGHSRKRGITLAERRELMLQGKYGIGLLGFWSIGRQFEMRSQVGSSGAWVLHLTEDEPRFEVERLRGRLPIEGTWTEVIVRHLHRSAFVTLGGRRIADYLAAELRGQLLMRPVDLIVHDKVARGRAAKVMRVEPMRYEGQPLALPDSIATPHGPVKVELYLLPEHGADRGRVTVAATGTIVYDDLIDYAVADFRHSPWTSGRITGVLDFAAFEVAPGTRRGVLPNDAAQSFVTAVEALEELLRSVFAEEELRLSSALEADLMKQLQRAFRDLPRMAPEYDFFAPEPESESAPITGAGSDVDGPTTASAPPRSEGSVGESPETEYEEPPTRELFPPGPLAVLELVPPALKVPGLQTRRIRARAFDLAGKEIAEGVVFEWSCDSTTSRIEPDGSRARVFAGFDAETFRLTVVGHQGERHATSEAIVEVTEAVDARAEAGIPQPEFVNEATGNWRSRFYDGRWQVNAGHRDYLISAESPRRKLRYLTALLAKEIVLHSFPHPQHGAVLERMVEVLTITDRRIG